MKTLIIISLLILAGCSHAPVLIPGELPNELIADNLCSRMMDKYIGSISIDEVDRQRHPPFQLTMLREACVDYYLSQKPSNHGILSSHRGP